MPYATVPYATVPYATLPYATVPYATLPYATLPNATLPYAACASCHAATVCQVLGTARNAGLVLVSAWLYNEKISLLEGVGYSISLAAFCAYNVFKIYGM